jgi:hypothetical protein
MPVIGSPPPAACEPGRDGIPDSWIGSLLCGQLGSDPPALGYELGRAWPLLIAVVSGCLIAVAVRWLRRQLWRRHAAAATWLEITPPVTATPPRR